MWVHPDLIKGQQWTTIANRKFRGKAKVSPCNVVCAFSRKEETDVPSLTDSEEETIVLAAEPNAPLVAGTHLGQSYLKKYDEVVANLPKFTQEPTKQSTKQPMEKQKEFRYAKTLPKDKAKGSLTPYRFDILAQLANIPARIMLYEILRLSKSIKKALKEALADAEWILAKLEEEDEKNCLHVSQYVPCITFTPDNIAGQGEA